MEANQEDRTNLRYGVATISRMLKNIGLFCKRALQKRPVFCKETCTFKHPTHRSQPIQKNDVGIRNDQILRVNVRCATGSEMVAGELDSVLATALI